MFDLVSAHDFYTMLVQDFDEFMEEPHSARKAVHCAITAHHLTDWVAEASENSIETRESQFVSFQKRLLRRMRLDRVKGS